MHKTALVPERATLQSLDSLQDLFKHESPALKEMQFKLLHKKKLDEVMNRIMKTRGVDLDSRQVKQSYLEKRMAGSILAPVFFDDLGSVNQVGYLLDKTSSLISATERTLRPNYQSTCAYFSRDLLLMHKLVNLYSESTQAHLRQSSKNYELPEGLPQMKI